MWTGAEAYEQLMGRWSRKLSPALIEFANVRDGERVLDAGCGTGSLTRALLEYGSTIQVVGVDAAAPYVEYGRKQIASPRATLEQGDAQSLPFTDESFHRCLSLLVFNFIPDAAKAAKELRRVTRRGGTVAAAVWDYGQGMEMLRILWDAACELDPTAGPKHERNMPYCREGELVALWRDSGLGDVEGTALTTELEFQSLGDYWEPFLAGVGPSGSYVSSLTAEDQVELQTRLRERLGIGSGEEPFTLSAKAWAVRGVV